MDPATKYWAERVTTYGPGWVDLYWDSWQRSYRHQIADAIKALFPEDGRRIGSILEIGCHCGPNLRLFRERWPHATLMGIDISAAAIAEGAARWGPDPNLFLWPGDYLETFAYTADVMVSCYALAYAPPDRFLRLIERIWTGARVGVVLAEPMVLAGDPEGPCGDIREWRHDYARALTLLGASSVSLLAVEGADLLNGIAIARKEP